MKKSELTQLTQIIEVLVQREIRKQLPTLIGEVFKDMAGRSMVVENTRKDYVGKEVETSAVPKDPHEFRASLKELFAGVTPVTRAKLEEGVAPPPRVMRQYAKDPVLNQILNETTSDLRAREGVSGMAAFHGGYNPGMPAGGSEMSIPIGQPPMLREGQESTHVPLSAIPDGISALDVARAGMTSPAVTEALTNYDRMKKILEASKGRRS